MGKLPDASLQLFFRLWDSSNDGRLQKNEVREMFSALRLQSSEEDLQKAFPNDDVGLTWDAFLEFIKRPSNSGADGARATPAAQAMEETSRGGDADFDGPAGGAGAR